MDDINKYIGIFLRKIRKQKRLSQQELASFLTLTHDAISDIENGKRALKVAEFYYISKILNITSNDLDKFLNEEFR